MPHTCTHHIQRQDVFYGKPDSFHPFWLPAFLIKPHSQEFWPSKTQLQNTLIKMPHLLLRIFITKSSSFLHITDLVLHTLYTTIHEERKAFVLSAESVSSKSLTTKLQKDGDGVGWTPAASSSVLRSQEELPYQDGGLHSTLLPRTQEVQDNLNY